ncbi:ATP-binding cassette sub-family C member 9-like [Anneissia japonica]|uniref:ATP-binding cassette sub-family C member 9-like n=1 Tax=Anneissia japonica TaxID=1529436 RepID=UPI001425783B|nr:ATP-binding cassette sub-family C member 9-like [Anneissia japonica]XP_033096647.1 ATP-binding cassette sub-family C member 9-like [Anneissia japonica]
MFSNSHFCQSNYSLLIPAFEWTLNGTINDPCFIDSFYLVVSVIFGVLALLILFFAYCCTGIRRLDRAFIVRYPFHCTRWLLCIFLCHTQFASIGEGVLTTVSTRSDVPIEPHLYVPQIIAFITLILMLSYYHHMEVWNVWPMVFLPLFYWIMAFVAESLRFANLQHDPNVDYDTVRWIISATNLTLYGLLALIELCTTLNLICCTNHRLRDKVPIDLEREGKNVIFLQGHTNMVSGILFWWLNDFVKLGSKTVLNPEDFGHLPRSLTAGPNAIRFYKHMYNTHKEGDEISQPSILRAYRKIYGFEFFVSAVAKGLSDTCGFIPALSVGRMVDYVSDIDDESDTYINSAAYVSLSDYFTNGFVLLVLATLAIILKGVFLQYSNYILWRQNIELKGALQSIIYDKSLRMSTSAAADGSCGMGEIANRVFVDTDGMQRMMTYIHNVWSIPYQVALALIFLYVEMGISALVGASLMLIIFPCQVTLARCSVYFQKMSMVRSDERLKAINEVIQGMKLVKLLGWEDLFYNIISKSRNLQIYLLRKQASIAAFIVPLGFGSPSFIALLSFVMYTLVEGLVLTPDVAFTAIPLIQNLSAPLLLLQPTVNQVVSGFVSIKRIEDFLKTPEIEKKDIGRTNVDSFSTLVKNEILLNGSNCADPMEYITSDKEYTSFRKSVDDARYGTFKNGGASKYTRMLPALPDDIILSVSNADFSWEKNSFEPTLKNINLEIPRNRLTIIVGQVGSGKSSLLSAFMGEMYTNEGNVIWNTPYSNISYGSQGAWLRNATVRDNIIFNNEYELSRYQEVVSSCALLPDIQILPAGDMTEIGEKGINLSGGQRQRISVARAMYSKNDVVILDDPMSALDVHVGAHVFDNGIKRWLLGNKRTVILVTHQLQYLPFADQIIVMRNGQIQLQGTFEEVASQDRMLYENWKKTMKEISETETEDEEDSKTKQERRKLKIQLTRSKNRQIAETNASSKPTEEFSMSDIGDSDRSSLIVKEDRNVGSVKYELYTFYVRMVGSALASLSLTAFLIEVSLQVSSNFWLSVYTDTTSDLSNTTEEQQESDLHRFLRGYAGFIGFGAVMTFFSTLLVMNALLSGANRIHRKMLSTILHAFMRFFDTTPAGRILNRFSSDMQVLDQQMLIMVPFLLRTGLLVIGGLLVNAIVSYFFILTILPIAIAYFFLLKYYLSSSRDSKRIESVTRSPVYSYFGETINGLTSVRAYQQQIPFFQTLVTKIDFNSNVLLFQQVLTLWLSVRLSIIGSLIILSSGLATLIPGVMGTVSSSSVGLAITYAIMMSNLLNIIVQRMAEVETTMNAIERSYKWTVLTTEPRDGGMNPPSYWPHRGEIIFDSTCVRYAPGLDTVLDNVTVNIKPGQKVGICGRTGSGKSSLTLALFRIIDTFRGRILIDGIDIAHIPLNSLRKRLAIIPQDPVLFTGTIRFNLDPDNIHNDKQLWEALEIAQLKRVVTELGTGLDSPVFEGGENFSVGQRQLFCLARAFLIKTKVLVMDEATASIDVKTDAVLQEVVRRVFKDRTVLTIAHRVATILDSDVIVVLSDGKVIEYDSPDRLLQRNSVFASLVKSNK